MSLNQAAAVSLECLLVLAGIALGVRLARSRVWSRLGGAPLAPWVIGAPDFLLFILLALGGGLALQVVAGRVSAHLALSATWLLIFAGTAFQAGMLAGIAVFHTAFDRGARGGVWVGDSVRDSARPSAAAGAGGGRFRAAPGVLRAGAATFLVALPVLVATTLVWQGLLTAAGLPVEKQDLIDLFANARSPWQRATLIGLAAGVAPVTEELIFRAGLFRYLRTRAPRWVALLGPSVLFGALHVDWKSLSGLAAFGPLIVLGVVFSLAYERTGRIGTTIVAHSLFNLNTIMLILAGVNV